MQMEMDIITIYTGGMTKISIITFGSATEGGGGGGGGWELLSNIPFGDSMQVIVIRWWIRS